MRQIFDFTNLSNNIVAQANNATQVGVAQGAPASSVPVVRLTSRSCWRSRTPARSANLRKPAHPWLLTGVCGYSFQSAIFHGHEHPRSGNYGKRVSTRCRCVTSVPVPTCREMLIPQGMARPGPSKAIRKPCKPWKVRYLPPQVRSTQPLCSSGGRPVASQTTSLTWALAVPISVRRTVKRT